MWFCFKRLVHTGRLEDISEVDAFFVEARIVEPRLADDVEQERFEKKQADLNAEVDRLKNMTYFGWTEYQTLSLKQLLADFLKPDELIARVQSSLEDLEDFANDEKFKGYDMKQYRKWESRIELAVERINGSEDQGEKSRDENANLLRADYHALLEHIAVYSREWAIGYSMLTCLSMFCVISLPTLVVAGILPAVTEPDKEMQIWSWILIGGAGALTAVLRVLYKSEAVEVGHTEGRQEVWRTIQGGILGMIAGFLIYAIISGGLITGGALPDLEKVSIQTKSLSALWAFAAGFTFEPVFARLTSSTSVDG